MAEFCLDCLNKIEGTNDTEKEYVLTDELELCENCGEWKRVVIMKRKYDYMGKFSDYTFPFEIIYYIICFIWNIIKIPFVIYKSKREKRNK